MDVTVVCPTAPSYNEPGAALDANYATAHAERAKRAKHGAACAAIGYTFTPIAFTTFGGVGQAWLQARIFSYFKAARTLARAGGGDGAEATVAERRFLARISLPIARTAATMLTNTLSEASLPRSVGATRVPSASSTSPFAALDAFIQSPAPAPPGPHPVPGLPAPANPPAFPAAPLPALPAPPAPAAAITPTPPQPPRPFPAAPDDNFDDFSFDRHRPPIPAADAVAARAIAIVPAAAAVTTPHAAAAALAALLTAAAPAVATPAGDRTAAAYQALAILLAAATTPAAAALQALVTAATPAAESPLLNPPGGLLSPPPPPPQPSPRPRR
jgi:hypothetical protein